ncbi:MAG: ABC transporter permease [Candidatus Acidiferrum sp.]
MFRRKRKTADFSAEVESHIQIETERLREQGLSEDEAQASARRAFGNVTRAKEEFYESSRWLWWDHLRQDVRFGLRMLRKSPGFTLIAVLTLALGIGANTAIFTLVHAILLKPLPVSHPQQLYNFGDDQDCCSLSGSQDSFTVFSFPLYTEIRDHTPEFSEIAAFQAWVSNGSVRRGGNSGSAQPFRGEFVSGNYFSMFDVTAFAGRTLSPADDGPGSPAVAVMSYRAWQARFASNPGVIGSTLMIDRQPVTVVGGAAPGFFGDTLRSDPPDFWFPLAAEPVLNGASSRLNQPDVYWLYAMGRLQPGMAPGRARAHLTSEIQHWIASRPGLSGYTQSQIVKLHFDLASGSGGVVNLQVGYASTLGFLMAVSIFVLLIACANIANLLLVRGAANRMQIAVRVALGASRSRLVRQMLTEGLMLALLGGAAGVLMAFAGTHAILSLAFRGAHYVPIDPNPSIPVLAFALAVSMLTGVIFSMAPAWVASHAQPLESLRSGGRSATDRSTLPQKSLLVLQATLALVLLVGAGLATESLRHLENQNFGFQTRGRLMVRLDSNLSGYSHERRAGLYEELLDRLGQLPAVQSASLSMYSPMEGSNWSDPISIEGYPAAQGADIQSSLNSVSAHYFETIGTRLLRGRYIDDQDTPASRRVAVIDESFARKYFPNEDPLGQHFGIGDESHAGDLEIVGVVEDAKYMDARAPAFVTAFLPLMQPRENDSDSFHDIQLLVAGSPRNLEPEIQRTLASVDPNLTVIRAISFQEQVSRNFNGDRLVARLSTLYGALALILACVGLYGVAAYTVARRSSEIGIRMALGAPRPSIVGMMLRAAMAPVALGLLIGLPISLAAGRAIASSLYGVKSYDPFVLGTAFVVLIISSVIAAVIPARRAASIDPVRALRAD